MLSGINKSVRAPKVTILMSVYNGENYVQKAIESMLLQTFNDFEFIIIDDGSVDKTAQILASYHDPRIIVINNEKNIGVPYSRNKGLKIARGEYIAVMDADDVSLPYRLEREVKFLEENPDVGVVGSSWYWMDSVGNLKDIIEAPSGQKAVHFMCHGSLLIRRNSLENVGFYREIFEYSSDYDLLLRLADKFGVANIKDPLYKLRLHSESVSQKKRFTQALYASLALALAEERKKKGKDRLSEVDKEGALKIRDRWFGMSAIEQRKAISHYRSVMSEDAHDLERYLVARGHAFDAITIWPFNYKAWKIAMKVMIKFSDNPVDLLFRIGTFVFKFIILKLFQPYLEFLYAPFFVIFRELRDHEWDAIKKSMAYKANSAREEDRLIVNGILYILYRRCAWSRMPSKYGSFLIAQKKLTQWCEDGTWDKVLTILGSTRHINPRLWKLWTEIGITDNR